MFIIGVPCHAPYLQFLDRCLTSIYKQTKAPDLIILSVSSCTDEVVPLVGSIPIKVLQTEQHHTPGQNRNAIIEVASPNSIISFIDADDMLHPQHVDTVSKFFANHEEQDVLVMSFERNANKQTFTVDDYKTFNWTDIPSEVQYFHNCYKPIYPPNWTPIMTWSPELEANGYVSANGPISFRRDRIDHIRYSPTITMGEDQHFNAQLWEHGLKFSYTPSLYFIYFTN